MYNITASESVGSPELVLCRTLEIPLVGMFANKVLLSTALPLKVVGLGHLFCAEAGTQGADTCGLNWVHQFTKVELFAIATRDTSDSLMSEMIQVQKMILEGLCLSFRWALLSLLPTFNVTHVLRIFDMPSEELGKYDMEAWMPLEHTTQVQTRQARHTSFWLKSHVEIKIHPSRATTYFQALHITI
jgi:seryl-tRNA synthetase